MLNFANRDCGALEIRVLETMKMFLDAPWCNTSTVSASSDSNYALKRGAKTIAFANPIDSTLKIEFQIAPFKAYSLFSDGSILKDGVRPFTEEITATGATTLTMTTANVVNGTICVYAATDDSFDSPIEVTVSDMTLTGAFTSGTKYVVRGLKTLASGIQRVEINNKRLPKDYYITIETTDKGEDGSSIPMLITAYKATPKRNFEMALSSSGDPVTITAEFDCLENKEGKQLDIAQIIE
jgi:hypothetical protein